MHTEIQTAANAVGFFVILLLSSLWCLGVNSLFQGDMILEPMAKWMDERFPFWVNKPLWRCPPCMASVHGSVIFFLFLSDEYGLLFWPCLIVCLAGINYVIVNR